MKVFEQPADLSEYLFRIVDNGGSSGDRYTVVFSDGTYLAMSSSPTHPQGISISGENLDPAVIEEWVEKGEAIDLALGDLAPHLIQHILDRNNDGLEDFLAAVEARDPRWVAPSREGAAENDGTHDCLGKGIYVAQEKFWIKLEGDASEDRGPYDTAREVVLATMPDHYSLSGPEYQTGIDLMRMYPDPDVKAAIEELGARRDLEWANEFARQDALRDENDAAAPTP